MDLSFVNDFWVRASTMEFTESVNSTMALLSILLLIVALWMDKKFSSASIGILVLSLGKAFETVALPHLFKIASTDALLNIFVWYGGWISLYLVCLALLVKFHQFFHLRPADVCYVLAWYYVFAIFLETIDFIEQATTNTGLFATIYRTTGLLSSLGLVPMIALVFFWEYGRGRRQLKLQEI